VHACLKSACAVLAWSILVVLVAAGMAGSVPPAQANIRSASSTTEITLASTTSIAAAAATAARPAARYVVQPGDTLSGIAARFAVRGGWLALYAANRQVIGPDPDMIRPGTVLELPGRMAPVRYTVAPGDTLVGIAAMFAVPGGWPTLYAANRQVIGPDPDMIRPGTVLTVMRPPAAPSPSPPAAGPGRRLYPAPPSAPAGSRPRARPVRTGAPAPAGMPQWLKTMLLVAGLITGAAFLAEPVTLMRRRRRANAPAAAPPERPRESAPVPPPRDGREPGPGRPGPGKARIVLADYHRVVVTRCPGDDTVYVLRPPGEAPEAILRAARLVLPEDPYEQLASQLGVPGDLPMK
jgi:LysM repeat protein